MSYSGSSKPLFNSSSSSSSAFENGGPNGPSADAVQQVQQLQLNPQQQSSSTGCCNCFTTGSTNCARRLLNGLGATNGVLIMLVGVVTGIGWVNNCPECGCAGSSTGTCANTCCYCVWTDVILPCYTVFLGGILTLAELRLPFIHSRCKDGCGFMFSLTWRVLYLAFIGSFGFAIKCQAFTWVGWGAGIFTCLNILFSCWMMNKHPGFLTLTGHEEYSETTERAMLVRGHSDGGGSAMQGFVSNGGGGSGGGSGGVIRMIDTGTRVMGQRE